MGEEPGRAERPARRWWLRGALLVLLSAPAFGLGHAATRGLSWPPDDDLYRDIAQAQTMADGALLADPFYRGESAWYNPLVPGLVAALAGLTAQPVHVVYARGGAFLNLLAPIAFFLLIEACFGLTAAGLATLHLVYLRDPVGPPWLSPAYSPWLYSAAFAPALFYASLLAYRRALLSGAPTSFAAAGLLLGLTFLGHAAPAVLGAVIITVGFAREAASGRGWEALGRHGLLAGTALAVASPFLWSIVGRYRLRVANPAPLEWVWPPMSLGSLPGFFGTYVSLPAAALATVALAYLVRRDPRRREAGLLATWALAAAGLFALSLLREGTGFGPRLLPRHHFFFYGRAAESALLGYGAATVLLALGRRVGRERVGRERVGRERVGRLAPAALVVAVAVAVVAVLPAYRERETFRATRRGAERDDSRLNRHEAREWIRAHSTPDDVFLAADDLALTIVGPAGRKVVALGAYFSNPYVDWRARHEDREALVEDLRGRRGDAFLARARRLGVGFVIHKRSDRWGPEGVPVLRREFQNARIGIYRVAEP